MPSNSVIATLVRAFIAVLLEHGIARRSASSSAAIRCSAPLAGLLDEFHAPGSSSLAPPVPRFFSSWPSIAASCSTV
jgi:hypothetical protein